VRCVGSLEPAPECQKPLALMLLVWRKISRQTIVGAGKLWENTTLGDTGDPSDGCVEFLGLDQL